MAASREARRCGGGGNGERAGRGAAAGAGGDALQSHPRAERTRVGARGGTGAQRLGAHVCTCVLRRVPRSGGPKGGKAALSVLRSFIRRSSEPQGGMERPRRRWVRAAAGGERRGGSEAPAAFEAEAKTPGVGGGRLTSWGRAR